MKRLVFLIISFLTAVMTGGDSSNLDKLWRDYESALNADRPQRQMEVLLRIKDVSRKERLAWDFYNAGQKYVSAASSRNWKLRDSLERQFHSEILAFDEPVLTFYAALDSDEAKYEYANKHRKTMEKSRNENFYSADWRINSCKFSPVLLKALENDWQYALWSLALGNEYSDTYNEVLKTAIAGVYPQADFLEFRRISLIRDEALRKFEFGKYARERSGKATALLAEDELLQMEFSDLKDSEAGALRDKCGLFLKKCKSFKDSEAEIAACCTQAGRIIDILDSKEMQVSIKDGVLTALLRNLPGMDVAVSQDKKLCFKTSLTDTKRRYYAQDTLSFLMPDLADGIYQVECSAAGDISNNLIYKKYSLAISTRLDAAGLSVFVADARTGEPLPKADITLKNRDDRTLAELPGFAMNGYTLLPESFVSKADNRSGTARIAASCIDKAGVRRSSQEVYALKPNAVVAAESTHLVIYTDRAAFKPEETVQYKVLAYIAHPDGGHSLVPAGTKLTVRLMDPTGAKAGEQKLTAGEFGSAAGSFVIPHGQRNGRYAIVAALDGRSASNYIVVDDFVLPTFDLTFDEDNRLYHPGDEVGVSGVIRSYSGHALTDASVTLTVREGGNVIKEERILPGEGGRFKSTFVSEGSGDCRYYITLRCTDLTGETLEWSTRRTVYDRLPFSAEILEKAEGNWQLKESAGRHNHYASDEIISSDVLKVAYNFNGKCRDDLCVEYAVLKDGKKVREGRVQASDKPAIDLSGLPDGTYTLKSVARDRDAYGNELSSEDEISFVRLSDGATSFDGDLEHVFKIVPGPTPALQAGTSQGAVWAVVDIHSEAGCLLDSYVAHVEAHEGSSVVRTFKLPVPDGPVTLTVKYFKNFSNSRWSHTFTCPETAAALPLKFTRFFDRTAPGCAYKLSLSTEPGVECVASIFDKSTETIRSNNWSTGVYTARSRYVTTYDDAPGSNRAEPEYYGGFRNGTLRKVLAVAQTRANSVNAELASDMLNYETLSVEDEASAAGKVPVRENFATTLAFEPFLHSDAQGQVEMSFGAADKLSTFVVQVLAHSKDVRTALLRREMVVTIPVKVSVQEPQFLYEGDRYVLHAALASNFETPVSGRLKVEFYNGGNYKGVEPFMSLSKDVIVPAGGTLGESFCLDSVPDLKALGIKLSFAASDESLGGDALFVGVPVLKPVQRLTEAHSSLLHSGEAMDALVAQLRSEFVNIPGDSAQVSEMSLLQMVRDAVPARVDAVSDNALSLSEALYVRALAERLGVNSESEVPSAELLSRLLECRRTDGGFSWFSTMDSSPMVTAVLLQRIGAMRSRGIEAAGIDSSVVEAAVKYLDAAYFGTSGPRYTWCGGLSFQQYLSVRAIFPEVRFDASSFDKKAVKKFARQVRSFLVPADERGLNGQILSKARRMRVLMNLSASEEGRSLARSMGIRLLAGKRLRSSLKRDLASLVEYAVEHRSGGRYYPNAVMPWRGLLESEAFAHSYIADLLRDLTSPEFAFDAPEEHLAKASDIAEGIRLWLMVQKETQKWDADAAFVDALASVMDASQATLDTRVVVLSATSDKPFAEVKASGNGFTLKRTYSLKLADGKLQELHQGDTLHVGDKILAEYGISNEENRSFVRISAPRPASMRPVRQLSGSYGWGLRPLSVGGFVIVPHGYRSVLPDRTEYWFDTYPEDNTVVSEELFVTQEGRFQMPSAVIESLYAPHYRACASGSGPLVSVF